MALAALPGAVAARLVHSDRPAGPPRTVSLEELRRIGGDGDGPGECRMPQTMALFAEQDRALPFRITWEVDPCDPASGEVIVAGDGRPH